MGCYDNLYGAHVTPIRWALSGYLLTNVMGCIGHVACIEIPERCDLKVTWSRADFLVFRMFLGQAIPSRYRDFNSALVDLWRGSTLLCYFAGIWWSSVHSTFSHAGHTSPGHITWLPFSLSPVPFPQTPKSLQVMKWQHVCRSGPRAGWDMCLHQSIWKCSLSTA